MELLKFQAENRENINGIIYKPDLESGYEHRQPDLRLLDPRKS